MQNEPARPGAGPFESWRDLLLDLIFPPRCAGCGRVDTFWCAVCQHEIDQQPFPPVLPGTDFMALQAVASTGNHADKLRLAVHSLKFDACPSLAQPLGERLSRRLATLAWLIDIILPVPLHTQREHDRGYNQSELLCAEVSRQSGLPMLSDALIRQIATRPQVGLDAAARHANMRNAFSADPRQVSAKTILLIDDVRTTGATLDACAQALHTAGAAGVYGLTVTSA